MITLKCSSCGAPLEVPEVSVDVVTIAGIKFARIVERVKCSHCETVTQYNPGAMLEIIPEKDWAFSQKGQKVNTQTNVVLNGDGAVSTGSGVALGAGAVVVKNIAGDLVPSKKTVHRRAFLQDDQEVNTQTNVVGKK